MAQQQVRKEFWILQVIGPWFGRLTRPTCYLLSQRSLYLVKDDFYELLLEDRGRERFSRTRIGYWWCGVLDANQNIVFGGDLFFVYTI